MAIFGACASAASLISAIQRFLDIGLISFFMELVSYYRKLTYPLIEAVPSLFHLSLPNWYKDQFIISFIIVTAKMRSGPWDKWRVKSGVKTDIFFEKAKRSTVKTLTTVFYATLFSLVLLGIPILINQVQFAIRNWLDPTLFDRVNYDPWTEVEPAEHRRFLASVAAVIIASVAFFAANAFLS